MSRLEDELRNALAWTRLTGWFRAPVFARAAMAGAFCLLVVLGVHYEQRQQLERVRGEAAKRQLLLALRVTGSSLRAVHDKLHELSAGYSDAQ